MPHETQVSAIGREAVEGLADPRPARRAAAQVGRLARRRDLEARGPVSRVSPRAAAALRDVADVVLRLPDPRPHDLAAAGLARHDGVVLGAVDEVLRAVDGVDGEGVVGGGIPLHERRVSAECASSPSTTQSG